MAQAQDVNTPQPYCQVVDRRNSPQLQADLQGLIIGSPSNTLILDSFDRDNLIRLG